MDFEKRAQILTRFKTFIFVLLIVFAILLVGLFLILSATAGSLTIFIIGLVTIALLLFPLILQYVVFNTVENMTYYIDHSIKVIKQYEKLDKGEER